MPIVYAPATADTPSFLTIGGVEASLYYGENDENAAIVERFTPEGFEATVRYRTAWASRFDFIAGLGGSAIRSGSTIIRTKPHQYPDNPNVWCTQVPEIGGIGPRRTATGWQTSDLAVVTAVYTRPVFAFDQADVTDPSGQPWTTTTIKLSGEVFTPPAGSFWYEGIAKPVEESSLGITRHRSEISVKRHWMPFAPIAEIDSFLGAVNSVAIIIGDKTYPPGTVLFAGGNITQSIDTAFNVIYEVEYIFMANGDGIEWTKLMDRSGVWRFVNSKQDGTGVRPFRSADFLNPLTGLP